MKRKIKRRRLRVNGETVIDRIKLAYGKTILVRRGTEGVRSNFNVAVHEAGHAVIARVFDIPCKWVTIVPDIVDNDVLAGGRALLGHRTQWSQLDHWERRHGKWRNETVYYRAMIICTMAGREAEQHLLGKSTINGDEGDVEQIQDSAFRIGEVSKAIYTPDDWPRWEQRMRRQTVRLVRKHQTSIERVAAALMRLATIDQRELDKLIRAARAD